jgi:hypothetical protein
MLPLARSAALWLSWVAATRAGPHCSGTDPVGFKGPYNITDTECLAWTDMFDGLNLQPLQK